MSTITPPTGSRLHQMDRGECLKRVGYGAFVGRIAFIHNGRPLILPVNYLLDQESVVFSSAAGTVLSSLDGAEVAFEVDDSHALDQVGWSVVIQGEVSTIRDSAELDRMRRGTLRTWAWQNADQWFRITIDNASGRILTQA